MNLGQFEIEIVQRFEEFSLPLALSYVIWTLAAARRCPALVQWSVTLLCLADRKVNSLLGVTTTG